MERIEALNKALEITGFINKGIRRLKFTRFKDIPLLATLPFFKLSADAKAGKSLNIDTLNFSIFEILVFGSVANENKEEVGDINMIVLDSGTYSTFFGCELVEDDWYDELSENIRVFLEGWLGYDVEMVEQLLEGFDVDLHLLPMEMLKSKTVREEIASKHLDPHFLQNAFSSILRYDKSIMKFVPANINYFETKYETDLSDLRPM